MQWKSTKEIMQTLIIEAENNKIKALKVFLNAFGVRYKENKAVPQDTTEYLLSNPANKKRLLESIEQLQRGEAETHNLIDL